MADYSMTRDPEEGGRRRHIANDKDWQKMEDIRGMKNPTAVDPETSILSALERCFKVANELAELTGSIEERLDFILFSGSDSPESATGGSLEADTAPAPMIGRLNDLERKLRGTKNYLSHTADRIAI